MQQQHIGSNVSLSRRFANGLMRSSPVPAGCGKGVSIHQQVPYTVHAPCTGSHRNLPVSLPCHRVGVLRPLVHVSATPDKPSNTSSNNGSGPAPSRSKTPGGKSKGDGSRPAAICNGATHRPLDSSVTASPWGSFWDEDLTASSKLSRTANPVDWALAAQADVGSTSTTAVTTTTTTTTTSKPASGNGVSGVSKESIQQQAEAALKQAADVAANAVTQAADVAATAVAQPAVALAGAAVAVDASIESGLKWRRRWTMVLLCFTAFMLCNMDRVNMAVAILPMSQQYNWTPTTMGLVQSSFFWGYLLTQVLGGVWASKYGGKLVLGLGVVWWSLATALTPIAAQAGLPTLMAARCLMGIGEGVAMPAMNQLLSRWVPVGERSRSLSLVYSGMFLGSMAGLTLSPQIIGKFGWPSVFFSFGALGIVWIAAWVTLSASTPKSDPKCTPQEKAYIAANTIGGGPIDLHGGSHSSTTTSSTAVAADDAEPAPIPWKALLSRKEVWAILGAHFCHNWGTFILLTWMPSYYSQVLGLDLASSATLSCLPWATMAIFANVGGWLADTAISKGATVTTVRKVMQTIGFLGPAFFLSQLNGVDTVSGAVICMMGAQGCDAFSQSGLYSNHQDIAPRYAGVLLGMSNTAGVLAGVLGSLVTGYILQHGTWSQVWQVAIALYLVGTAIWNAFSTGERIFD